MTTASMNYDRLSVVVVGVMLYLFGGGALGFYCFYLNSRASEAARLKLAAQAGDDGDVGPAIPAPPPGPAVTVDPAEQRQIDDAIVKGVWYLRDRQQPTGTWGDTVTGLSGLSMGLAALPGLTLLECGVPADDPAVQKAAALVRAQAAQLANKDRRTYQMSLAILFLDRLGDYNDRGLIQYLALCLIAGQCLSTEGGWDYNCPVLDRGMVPQLLELLNDPKQSLEEWRKAALKGGTYDVNRFDNSNTQFAVLALWVAHRPQYRVPIDKTVARLEKYFQDTQVHHQAGAAPAADTGDNQDLDGSWYYQPGHNSNAWPSMTCSGLLGLGIGYGVSEDANDKKQPPLDDPAIKAGLAMLAREIDKPNDKRKEMDLYFLWSLERVAVLYQLSRIDEKDWYAWGSKALLTSQQDDGSWKGQWLTGDSPVVATSFALLFLERANLVQDLTTKLQLLQKK
jgi:hypothetical protein